MKKIFTSAMLLLLGLLSLHAQTVTDTSVPKGMEQDAHAWCKAVKVGWNLGNSLESMAGSFDDSTEVWSNISTTKDVDWEMAWQNPKTTEAMIRKVKAAGFNAVRIPVLWQPHVTNLDDMTIKPEWLARVKEVVNYCIKHKMYVILDTHHEQWLEHLPYKRKQAKQLQMLRALWTNIATAFAHYDGHLAFSGTNEVNIAWRPPTEENLEVQNSYNQTFVDAVRATGGKNRYRNLIVQTYSCNPDYGLQGLIIPHDVVKGRLSVEFHYYTPYRYCSGNKEAWYYWGKKFAQYGEICPDGDEQTLADFFSRVRQHWYDQGLGVVIGEYGVSCHYKEAEKQQQLDNMSYYMEMVTREANKNGFAAFVWDNNYFGNGEEVYGIFDRNDGMKVRTPFLLKGIMKGAK